MLSDSRFIDVELEVGETEEKLKVWKMCCSLLYTLSYACRLSYRSAAVHSLTVCLQHEIGL